MSDITIQTRAVHWITGTDTGMSSKTLWAHMMGDGAFINSYPQDVADFGRCVRLLDMIPEWRERLPEMASFGPEWASLVEQWDELEETYKEDHLTFEYFHKVIEHAALASEPETTLKLDPSVMFVSDIPPLYSTPEISRLIAAAQLLVGESDGPSLNLDPHELHLRSALEAVDETGYRDAPKAEREVIKRCRSLDSQFFVRGEVMAAVLGVAGAENEDWRYLTAIMDEIKLLRSALARLPMLEVASVEPQIDPLGSIAYFWPIENKKGKVKEYRLEWFRDGRPTDYMEYLSPAEIKAEGWEHGARLQINDQDVIAYAGEPPKPYLYILMRTDMPSMNPGKAMAQATHAANQMVKEAHKYCASHSEASAGILEDMLDVWSNEANGFGTCIVLGVTKSEMYERVARAKEAGLHAGITNDPTYPLKDGANFFAVSVDTCAYVFDYKAVCSPHLEGLQLHP